MLVGLFVTTALAAPPEGVDVHAVGAWQDRAVALRRGPSACYRLEGTARSHIAVFRPPSLFSRGDQTDYVYEGTFSGRFEDGRWTDFTAEVEPTSEAARSDEEAEWSIPVHPLVGRGEVRYRDPTPAEADGATARAEVHIGDDGDGGGVDGSGSAREAVSLLDTLLDEIDTDVTTTWSEWSDEHDAVELNERFPLGDSGKEVELVTRFPGGAPVPSALDVTFPKRHRVRVEGVPIRITLLRPQLHVRTQPVGGEPMPVYESLSLAVGAFGFTVGFEQRLTYARATPCEPAAAESAGEAEGG